ncbi:hypothetical protein D3C73_1256540 [compost metagenome]
MTPIFLPFRSATDFTSSRTSTPSARPKLLGVAITWNWRAPAAIKASDDTTPVPARSMLPAITALMRSEDVAKLCHLMSRPCLANRPVFMAM